MPGVAAARRHDLTDAQWAGLRPVLPAEPNLGRPPRWTKRQIINGIRWRVRTGSPWRDVPEVHAPWILARLQAAADAAGRTVWTVSVDSTISRAHQHAAGARRDGHLQEEPPGVATTGRDLIASCFSGR